MSKNGYIEIVDNYLALIFDLLHNNLSYGSASRGLE